MAARDLCDTAMRIALLEPDIAGNLGTILRLSACLGVAVDVIEPCGFPFSDRKLKRAGMDYAAQAEVQRHADWEAFSRVRRGRLVLLTTRASTPYHQVTYRPDDILLLGKESAGAPDHVHETADLRVRIQIGRAHSELQSLMRISYAVFRLKTQTKTLH